MTTTNFEDSEEYQNALAQFKAKQAQETQTTSGLETQPNITQVAGGGYDGEEAPTDAPETPIAPPVEQSAAPQETIAQTQTGEATKTDKEKRKAERKERRENADFKDVTVGSVAANALALPLALMGVNLPELNQQIREQRYMRTSKLGEEYKTAMASGDEKKMDDWMTKLQQRNFDHTNTGNRYGTKISDLLAAQGKEKVMNYLATEKPDRNYTLADAFADMKKQYGGSSKNWQAALQEQMALRHARQNELAKIGVDETRAEADKTKADTDAFGDLRKGTQWFTYEADANKNYGLPDGYTIGQGGNTATNKAGDVLHLRQDSKDNKFWAKEEDANLKWKAKLKEAEAAIQEADTKAFVSIMEQINKQRDSMVRELYGYLGIRDLDLDISTVSQHFKKNPGELLELQRKYGNRINVLISTINSLNGEISRVRQAALMSNMRIPGVIRAFTKDTQTDDGFTKDVKRRDFYTDLQDILTNKGG